jgi:peptidyl-prolyl cis-trans isomerase B (cyclophilin B)
VLALLAPNLGAAEKISGPSAPDSLSLRTTPSDISLRVAPDSVLGDTAQARGELDSLDLPPPEFPFPAADSIPAVDVLVVVQKFGEFRIRFYRDDAPNHVAHFLTLAATGFYDGMSFHRVIPDFLIQTGDPNSRDEDRWNDGFAAPPYRLPHEPSRRTHRRGSVSMAWRGDSPGSAGTQWLVSLGDHPEMDRYATVIGEVIEGMEAVDGISQVTTLRNWNPLYRVLIEEVRLTTPLPLAATPSPPPVSSAVSG